MHSERSVSHPWEAGRLESQNTPYFFPRKMKRPKTIGPALCNLPRSPHFATGFPSCTIVYMMTSQGGRRIRTKHTQLPIRSSPSCGQTCRTISFGGLPHMAVWPLLLSVGHGCLARLTPLHYYPAHHFTLLWLLRLHRPIGPLGSS